MTDKEKKALREAFDFPEPDRKEEFLAEFARLSVNNNKKRLFPVVMRFAAAAAMIAIIVGVFAFMPKDTVDFGHDNDEIITVTETTSVPTSSAVTAATTAVTTSKAVRTDKTTSAKTTSTAVTTAKQATTDKTVTAQRTEASQRTTAVRTTAVHTTVRTTSAAEKTEAAQKPVTTTTAPPEDIVPPHGGNKDSERNMTVPVDMTYPLREKTLTEDQIYPKDSGFENQGPISSKPVDTSALLESMYNDSSAVVLANTDEMLYTSIDGAAVTAENLSIVSSYKGDLRENDRITVFFSGGYVPAEKYLENHSDVFIPSPEEYSVYEKGSSRFPQKKGELYIFFIKNDESIKNGAYSPVRSGNTAVFRKIQDNYVSVDDSTLYFTEAQLNELK
ncbi:hypothetical protein [Ruminococcus flavefaciens]|uniref:hypothetical protein n=1 Tax=Ruminococcus flavefaciens TaxID=1265 RepID=UPI0026EE76B0|nr:hypothetical protein [Ruminococcus flavefaciens]